MSKVNLKFQIAAFVFLLILAAFLITGYFLQKQLIKIYNNRESLIVTDRKGKEIFVLQNSSGNLALYLNGVPSRFKELLIKKEDKLFYYHFGFNPFGTVWAALNRLGVGQRKASSTLTQQLVKILLRKEFDRTLKNKIIELFYAISLEIYQPKEEILKMYANSVYFGNQAQGLNEASLLYFKTAPDLLADEQILQLLAAISSPAENNPAKEKNKEIAVSLIENLDLNIERGNFIESAAVKENLDGGLRFNDLRFELQPFLGLKEDLKTTLDSELNEKIREIVKRNIEELREKNARNGAVIVIKLPENELLTLVGSPDPKLTDSGYKINMLWEPRPIGSTIKPFIYLKAFEKGLRPYTLVDDREYKYITALGFPLYPKNFDYQYRGEVNLHYALSNSLNVPAVKVLEYVGLEDFYDFLENNLKFKPVQNLKNYQLGIALGALEMDLMDLAKYFTIFPNKGVLKELTIYADSPSTAEIKIAEPKYIQLVNKILNDRKTGIEQFGFKSELNLFQNNYALKTGTSRDFKDSWVVGFTPDFLVGVWVGNADNTKTDEVSGQTGAGNIWAEIMELLLNSGYNKKTPLVFNSIAEFKDGNNVDYGLANDDYAKSLLALKQERQSIILNPHDNDLFLLEENSKIILNAEKIVKWYINGEFLTESQNTFFSPLKTGQYQIKAAASDGAKETVVIYVAD